MTWPTDSDSNPGANALVDSHLELSVGVIGVVGGVRGCGGVAELEVTWVVVEQLL
jgi:hypothetical protein